MACFDAWDIGACGCGFSITCKGCNSTALVTYAVDIYNTSGGTLLYSLTTDSSGHISLPGGTYWIQSADGFFAGPSFTVRAPASITLTAATNYVCATSCCALLPIPRTLSITDTIGTYTATWSNISSSWETGLGVSNNVSPVASCTGGTTCTWQSGTHTGTTSYFYSVTCQSVNHLTINRFWYVVTKFTTPGPEYCPAGCHTSASGGPLGNGNSNATAAVTCGAIAWSGTLTWSGTGIADPVGGTVSYTQ